MGRERGDGVGTKERMIFQPVAIGLARITGYNDRQLGAALAVGHGDTEHPGRGFQRYRESSGTDNGKPISLVPSANRRQSIMASIIRGHRFAGSFVGPLRPSDATQWVELPPGSRLDEYGNIRYGSLLSTRHPWFKATALHVRAASVAAVERERRSSEPSPQQTETINLNDLISTLSDDKKELCGAVAEIISGIERLKRLAEQLQGDARRANRSNPQSIKFSGSIESLIVSSADEPDKAFLDEFDVLGLLTEVQSALQAAYIAYDEPEVQEVADVYIPKK